MLTDKVFTFLSADEVEKLKQEEEKKMASLSRSELGSWSPGEDRQSGDSSHSDDEPYENGHRYIFFVNENRCSMNPVDVVRDD